MANVRDSDTSLWLHNKLGTSNDSWTGGSICTQLNAEVLKNIKDCFPDLQTQVKLKLLLSFFHIPRRNVEEWKTSLEEIIEVAGVDSELWVSMLAEVLKTFPSTGNLNTDICEFDESRPIFSDMISELRRLVNKSGDLGLLPLECQYLNKAALTASVGQQPNPVKHFTLKRKPKSVALRTELLQKSVDAQANLKKSLTTTVPVRSRGMPRKMTDTTPLKGLPSLLRPTQRGGIGAAGAGLNTSTANATPRRIARPPGIKLLDISDQPHLMSRKRKKHELLEESMAKEIKEEKKSKVPLPSGSPPAPDYAAGLAYPMPAPLPEPTTPAPAAGAVTATPVVKHEPKVEVKTEQQAQMLPVQNVATTAVKSEPQQITRPILVQQGSSNVVQKVLVSGQKPLLVSGQAIPLLIQGGNTIVLNNMKPMTVQSSSTATRGQPNIIQQTIIQQPQIVRQQVVQQQQPGAQTIVQQVGQQQTTTVVQQIGQQQPQTVVQQQTGQTNVVTQQPALLPRRGLSLTREQMLEAQDMFRNANRVTRPEKALILGFMAGSRENPCPNLGNIVTIKLSENIENVLQSDDTYLTMQSEMHFQMNYNNGQWSRLKKYRPIDGVLPQKIPPGAAVRVATVHNNNTTAS